MSDLARVKEVMEAIASRREMSLEPKTTSFGPAYLPLPLKGNFLRITQALNRLDIPLLTKITRALIASKLSSPLISFQPGFDCMFGNIIGENISMSDTRCIDYANIYLGRGASFSFQNIIITSTHDFEDMGIVRAKEIIIGENVWVTSRVVILPGVKIGHNSVIGSGSVVSSDIPPNCFAAGVPAKLIKVINRKAGENRVSY